MVYREDFGFKVIIGQEVLVLTSVEIDQAQLIDNDQLVGVDNTRTRGRPPKYPGKASAEKELKERKGMAEQRLCLNIRRT